MKETEARPSVCHLVSGQLSQLSKEGEHYFPTTEYLQIERNEFVTHLPEEDQLLVITNGSGFKSIFDKTSNV